MKQATLITGGFDPLHKGHIEYMKAAKNLTGRLIVGLNSDDWLTRKKGKPFMSWEDRASIIRELKIVDKVFPFDDKDNTACHAIFLASNLYDRITFANGGDRNLTNTPEYEMYKNRTFVDWAWNVGGGKQNSSSDLLKNWRVAKDRKDTRWGSWEVLDESEGYKVKKLIINPNSHLSMQRHYHRAELWTVVSGRLELQVGNAKHMMHKESRSVEVPVETWHQAVNSTNEPCIVIELQHGNYCEENDIERELDFQVL